MKPDRIRTNDLPGLATPPAQRSSLQLRRVGALALLSVLVPTQAYAMEHDSGTIDKIADVLTWIVLVVAPIVGIVVFLLVHILPEKIAEKKQHPQAKAIQCLCLLSLAFGGMLWPLAWLWAYTKPVLFRMAYGTDRVPHGSDDAAHGAPSEDAAEELKRLRQRVAELESGSTRGTSSEAGRA